MNHSPVTQHIALRKNQMGDIPECPGQCHAARLAVDRDKCLISFERL